MNEDNAALAARMGKIRSDLTAFVKESNRIEGIERPPTREEVDVTFAFLQQSTPTVADVEGLVAVYESGAKLRIEEGMDVRVGSYVAPPGGPQIGGDLAGILKNLDAWTPFVTHRVYQDLHPFEDGNGRSGRAIWLWQMERFHGGAPLGFLHHWYFSSLEAGR